MTTTDDSTETVLCLWSSAEHSAWDRLVWHVKASVGLALFPEKRFAKAGVPRTVI